MLKTELNKPIADAPQNARRDCQDNGKSPSAKSQIERVFLQYRSSLVRYLTSIFGQGPPDPEDIAQRAFEKILLRGGLEDVTSAEAFLKRTARNIAVSEIRAMASSRKAHENAQENSSDASYYQLTPENVLEGKERLGVVMKVLSEMPLQRRRAFVLTRIDGHSHTEAARRLGISRPAVSAYVASAAAQILFDLSNNGTQDEDEETSDA